MTSQRCPECATESTGSFCPECGASLRSTPCDSCGELPPAGASYCTHCGARLRGGSRGGRLTLAIGGAAVLGLVLIFALRGFDIVRADGSVAPAGIEEDAAGGGGALQPGLEPGEPPASAPGLSPEGSPPPLTGTRREQADRLFTRIMETAERGDTAEAEFFVPMALEAYRAAGDLDDDGLYHLSVIQEFAGDYTAARESAELILEESPRHLLGLGAAAQAAESAGDEEAARDLYRRFLDAANAEAEQPLPEYRLHSAMLPTYRSRAEAFLSR